MTAIINYGVGNLFSLVSSLEKIGNDAIITSDISEIENADRIILPGVGAFEDAAKKLFESGLVPAVKKAAQNGMPILGICLGMQLLFDYSLEYGRHEGLSMIPGKILPIPTDKSLKIPHMGWNVLNFQNGKHPLFKYINDKDYVYFVHSFYAECDDKNIIAKTEYGKELTAAVARENVMGCQFHPEKSSECGLSILRAFCEMKKGDFAQC
ncbi:MAG: imidazole glycerol phosphate synthase subunit HisH [Clostridia bacterium]|nr:imidazole glycerol phosphate synthase subunit HisH [Clostridia bacterium]